MVYGLEYFSLVELGPPAVDGLVYFRLVELTQPVVRHCQI